MTKTETATAALHGVQARIVLEESIVDPGYVRVTLICQPPPQGYDREVYSGLIKTKVS